MTRSAGQADNGPGSWSQERSKFLSDSHERTQGAQRGKRPVFDVKLLVRHYHWTPSALST